MKNSTDVYYWWEEMYNHVPWAYPKTFQSLYSINYYTTIPYGKDDTYVYMLGQRVKDMDPDSIEILTSFYLQDNKKIIYFDGDIYHQLKQVDRKTFEISDGDGYDAKDKNGFYLKGEKVDIIEVDNTKNTL